MHCIVLVPYIPLKESSLQQAIDSPLNDLLLDNIWRFPVTANAHSSYSSYSNITTHSTWNLSVLVYILCILYLSLWNPIYCAQLQFYSVSSSNHHGFCIGRRFLLTPVFTIAVIRPRLKFLLSFSPLDLPCHSAFVAKSNVSICIQYCSFFSSL